MSLSAPEPLGTQHRLEGFDCGKPSLNDWLLRHARQAQGSSSAKTFVVVDDERLAGYHSLTVGQVDTLDVPERVSAAAFRQLDESLDDCPHCHAAFGIDVEFAQDTVVRPDVLVICYQPDGERLTRAPDLIFEVISPRTARRDEVVKFDLYRAEGVSHYVLVSPEAQKAKVWRLVDGEYRKVGDFHDESHRFELSRCALDFDFGRLWKRKGGQA